MSGLRLGSGNHLYNYYVDNNGMLLRCMKILLVPRKAYHYGFKRALVFYKNMTIVDLPSLMERTLLFHSRTSNGIQGDIAIR